MLRKLNVYLCLLLLTASLYVSSAIAGELCSDCEEEIWEEVPCNKVIPTTTIKTYAPTSTTTPIPTTTTVQPTTTPPPTTAPPTTKAPPTTTTTLAPVYTTPAPPLYPETTTPSSDQFKNCYCECKVGCKEFCRKIVVNVDPKKRITQTNKIVKNIQPGRVEIKHIHERLFVPNPYYDGSYGKPAAVPKPIPAPKPTVPVEKPAGPVYPIENSGEINLAYDSPKPSTISASADARVAAPAAYPERQKSNYNNQNAAVNSPSLSLDEISKLLAPQVGYNNNPYAYYSQNQQQQDYNQQIYGSEAVPPVPTYDSPQFLQPQNQAQEVQPAYYQSPPNALSPNSYQPQEYAQQQQQYSQVPEPNVGSYSNDPAQIATGAAAAVASSAISDFSNSNYNLSPERQYIADNSNLQYPQDSSYLNPTINENNPPPNYNLNNYLKDYGYSQQTSVNAYPDYQLSYPSY